LFLCQQEGAFVAGFGGKHPAYRLALVERRLFKDHFVAARLLLGESSIVQSCPAAP
jgi:hypothetical protein